MNRPLKRQVIVVRALTTAGKSEPCWWREIISAVFVDIFLRIPARYPGAFYRVVLNALKTLPNVFWQVADQEAVFSPLRAGLFPQRLYAGGQPAFAGLGFRNDAKDPGVADYFSGIGHATVQRLAESGFVILSLRK